VLRIWCPKDDGSEKDEWTKRSFKGFTTAIEKSNPGYQWNWDEASLAGKLIGILFRQEEWEYNNMHGWAVRPFKALSADSVRNGEFTIPAEKPLKKPDYTEAYNSNTSGQGGFTEFDDDESELPF
jgi:hypothetical protein